MSDAIAVETVSRPLRKDAARNRAALVAAAREVFAERGLEASLDDIAHRAGVGVGTAYRHFANKYDLAGAILREAIDEIVELAETCAQNEDAWAGLVGFLEGVCSAQTADRGLREVMMGMHDEELAEETNERMTAPLTTIVDRAHASGELPAEIELSDVGMLIVSLCTIADVSGDVSPDLWRRYLPMFLAGLRAGVPLGVPALDPEQLADALSSHKQKVARTHR